MILASTSTLAASPPSSLAVAIAYPDLVAMGGVVLNQSGHAIEVFVIWMIVYLGLSLTTAAIMNLFVATQHREEI